MDKEVEAYIASFPEEIGKRLMRIREIFLHEVPEAEEGIKYRMPTIIWKGNLVHYAAFQKHIGVYPLPHVVEALAAELADYKTGKGSIQFDNDRPLPEELITRIVRMRKEERIAELAAKKGI